MIRGRHEPVREPTSTLLITCPDRPGLVAGVAGFLVERDANIVHADQYVDLDDRIFTYGNKTAVFD